MLLRRRRARRLAYDLAQRLGGAVAPEHVTFGPFETARVMVTATFEGMKLRCHVSFPWVHVEDFSFASHDHQPPDLAVNAPLHGMAMTTLACGLPRLPYPVYVGSEPGREAAERFFSDDGNRSDVATLDLKPGEWLQITRRQLWLRCRAGTAEDVMARLGPLARLHARAGQQPRRSR